MWHSMAGDIFLCLPHKKLLTKKIYVFFSRASVDFLSVVRLKFYAIFIKYVNWKRKKVKKSMYMYVFMCGSVILQ